MERGSWCCYGRAKWSVMGDGFSRTIPVSKRCQPPLSASAFFVRVRFRGLSPFDILSRMRAWNKVTCFSLTLPNVRSVIVYVRIFFS
jgi:hypothetical protein